MKLIPDSVPTDVKILLQKFPSILRTGDVKPTPIHGVEHHIHTGSHPPVFAKSRCLDPEKLEIAKAEFKRLKSAGNIHCSKSPWLSPLHRVPKKDDSWRPCGDYHHLNCLTTLDKYPLPNMHLVNSYDQILVAAADNPKSAIITPLGLFEYFFTPFGLSNTTQTFQRMMDRTTDGLEGVFAYMDDSCVGSQDRQTHLCHLEAFFTALATNSLAINLDKCVFAAPTLEILGHTISAARPHGRSHREIELCSPPQDIKQLQRFLGMMNFYCCFLPNGAHVLRPLTDLLKGGGKTLKWTASAQEAIQGAKRLLAAAVPLQHPAPTAELSLATDASHTHVGGVMQLKSGGHWQPLGFFFRKQTDTESHYSTFDRESLAAFAAIRHFCHFSEG
jgi:hypothetical protein